MEEKLMKIDFHIAESERIPTRMRLKVDETIDVYYEPLKDAFGYKFDFFPIQGVTLEMATSITDEIVHRMVSQSYDHGAQWRECGTREIVNDKYDLSITVYFYIRDAW